MSQSCVNNCVCDKVVCSSLRVKEMCETKLRVKELCVEVCVRELCVCVPVPQAPHLPQLPHKTKVDLTKCHTSRAKTRGCHQVPRLPRLPHKTKVDVTKRHTCHTKRRLMSPSDTKRRLMSPSATPPTQNEGGCHQAPRLPHKTKVDVTKRHMCHTK